MLRAGLVEVVIELPLGWEDRSQIIMVRNSRDEFLQNMVLVREDLEDRSLETVIDSQLGTLRQTFDGFSLLSKGATSIGQHSGYMLDYGFVAADKSYRQRQFFTIANNSIYIFTYSNLRSNFDKGLELTEKIVADAQILPRER